MHPAMGQDLKAINHYTVSVKSYQTTKEKKNVLNKLSYIVQHEEDLPLEDLDFLYKHTVAYSADFQVNAMEVFPVICKYLHQIHFTHTISFKFPGCVVQSIEALAFLNAPNLKIIVCSNNHITSIKALSKNPQFNQLQRIFAAGNPIKDLDKLTNINSEEFMVLDLKRDSLKKSIYQNYNFMFKLKAVKNHLKSFKSVDVSKKITVYFQNGVIRKSIETYSEKFKGFRLV